ncbi:MAG: aminoacyl-tRNA hydrolase [Zoogloeaceae bacterium]|jgi:PTH1 family peptidyl-tRNA hydrolase|nr:aminoacyl-tRNA hydrolase [Zoogloeaceae bacterium]
MNAPRLIVGLGNPGSEYAATRHNTGFWLVDRLAVERSFSLAPQARFFGLAGRQGDCHFLKPTTFMNRSGQAVGALARFYRIPPAEILVVHDDLDLPPGAIRLKQGGGNGGHNGLKDIEAALSTSAFWRLRLGVGHPRTLGLSQPVLDFVLHRPRAEEQEAIDAAITRCLAAWPTLAAGDYSAAQRILHPADGNCPSGGKTFPNLSGVKRFSSSLPETREESSQSSEERT